MKSGVYSKVATHQAESAGPLDPSRLKPDRLRCLITMMGSLLAGLALVVTQCIVYWYLSGKTVSSTIPQAWASRVGTALAFLVKLLFATAAGTAYVQRQWLALSATSWEVRQIDSLTGILGNVLLFRDVKLWFKHPLLLCLATITWLIPLAAVIAPGSLAVTFQQHHNSTNVGVPQYSYDYATYGQTSGFDTQTGALNLVEASIPLRRVAMAAATSGQISSMPALFQNYTYEQRFYAPALRCMGANESMISNLTASVYTAFAVEEFLRFLAFTPTWALDLSGPSNATAWDGSTLYSGMDGVSQDVFRMFVVPDTTDNNLNELIECNLRNASYTTRFAFQNGVQDVQSSQVDLLNDVAPVTEVGPRRDSPDDDVSQSDSEKASYTSIMLAFTRLIVGYAQDSHYGGSSTSYTSYDMTSVNWTTRASAIEGLETLFQNITLSVLSVPDLTKNETSAEKLAVDIVSFPLTYSFEPEDILIAYGLAFGFALFSVGFGVLAVMSQGGSFQNIFSTFVRVTRGTSFNAPIHASDDGMDPLPKPVGGTRLRIGGVRNQSLGRLSDSAGSSFPEGGGKVQHSHTI